MSTPTLNIAIFYVENNTVYALWLLSWVLLASSVLPQLWIDIFLPPREHPHAIYGTNKSLNIFQSVAFGAASICQGVALLLYEAADTDPIVLFYVAAVLWLCSCGPLLGRLNRCRHILYLGTCLLWLVVARFMTNDKDFFDVFAYMFTIFILILWIILGCAQVSQDLSRLHETENSCENRPTSMNETGTIPHSGE